MEEHPHQQHSPSTAQVDTVPSRKQAQRYTVALRHLLDFVQNYPLLTWGGIWVSILLVAAIAVGGLLSPGLTSGRRATGAAFGSSAIGETEITASNGRATFWIFGAIAITCTAGSILVSKRFSRPPLSHHKLSRPKRPKPYVASAPSPQKPHSKPKTRRAPQQRRQPVPPVRPSMQPKRLRPFSPDDLPPLPVEPIPTVATTPPQPIQAVSFALRAKPVPPAEPTPQPVQQGVKPLVPGAIAPSRQQPVSHQKSPLPAQAPRPPQAPPKQVVTKQGATKQVVTNGATKQGATKQGATKQGATKQGTTKQRPSLGSPSTQPFTPPTPVPQTAVTVVPAEENHPLDWQESSIADLMDIRKRHSLSSWL